MTFTADFGKTAADYARHRAGFPAELFRRLRAFGIGAPGQRLLDLGAGTGALAREFAARGCAVIGVDIAAALMAEGRRLAGSETRLGWVQGRAEMLPFERDAFDVVSAGQCWHWFERAQVAAEVWRVLRPGGRLVIAHFDWIPAPGNVVAATEELILQHNPSWTMAGGTGLYPAWLGDVMQAGFSQIETFSFDVSVPYSHEAWRGRIRASAGVAASLKPIEVATFDSELKALLESHFPADPLDVPHRTFALICRKITTTR
ncbi:MAG: class I SAM-dependent methyltransferase [Caldilineales bacterium]|nr:class I SAM-dependent methyltransferase [Caldilineales bacterium]